MDPKNSASAERRTALAEEIAEDVLRLGLGDMALRDIAERRGTSGRMLLYYFGTKDALVVAVLERISLRLAALLATRSTGERIPPSVFLARVLDLAARPEVAPFMRVWSEVIARGARAERPYDQVARAAVRDWIGWIESRLTLPEYASAILAVVEGVTLLELASPGSTIDARALLPHLLEVSDEE